MIAVFASTTLLGLGLTLGPAPGDSVEEVLARGVLDGARVAVAVVDAESGERLFSRSIDTPMTPASNMKLLTTAAAVAMLGPDFHFATRVLSPEGPDQDGVLQGDLILVGGGDPCLRADALGPQGIDDPAERLVQLLGDAGVTRVDGALVLDDGYLDRQWVHPDWDPNDLAHDYAAPVSALSIHGNTLTLAVDGRGGGSAPRARIVTEAEGYELQNQLVWATRPDTFVVSALRPDDSHIVRLRGRLSRGLGEHLLAVPVHDGALLFGRCLRSQLEAAGITVRGGLLREADARQAMAGAVELVRFETPLSLAVVLANKESDNSISDHLFKILGAEVEGDGSFEGGALAVTRFLREFVDTRTDGLVLRDGSGLSRGNAVTARVMVDTLVALNRAGTGARDLYLRTLPVSGMDGTLLERLTDEGYRGAVRAKTGYIQGVSALSGYAHAHSGRLLAFSILINDVPRKASNRDMKRIQDDICRNLVDRW